MAHILNIIFQYKKTDSFSIFISWILVNSGEIIGKVVVVVIIVENSPKKIIIVIIIIIIKGTFLTSFCNKKTDSLSIFIFGFFGEIMGKVCCHKRKNPRNKKKIIIINGTFF
jgi:hypothetical protein